jgi:hypothetical protein
MKYITTEGQSIFDIAIILTGDMTKAVDIANKNGLSISNFIPNNTVIEYDVEENFTTNFINQNKLGVNTSDPAVFSGKDYNNDYNNDYN